MVASRQEGPGLVGRAVLCGVCTFLPCVCEFPPQWKNMDSEDKIQSLSMTICIDEDLHLIPQKRIGLNAENKFHCMCTCGKASSSS